MIGYHAAHWRTRARRGRAGDLDCILCQQPAAHWAYTYNDPNEMRDDKGRVYSGDPSFYVPMCGSCHKSHDMLRKPACGTDRGYYRHRKAGTKPCAGCLAGHAAAQMRRKSRRAAA